MEKLTHLVQPEAQGIFKKCKRTGGIGREGELVELFPLPQYFQVHFQSLHDHNTALRKELAKMTQQLIVIEAKLNQLSLAEKSVSNRC